MSDTPSSARYANSAQQAGMQSEVLLQTATKEIADSAHRISAVSELAPIRDLKIWIARLLRSLGDSISHIWTSIQDFMSRVPGYILAGLKSAAEWLVHAPSRFIAWLWRVPDLGSFVLGLAKWTAIACGVVCGVVVISWLGIYVYQRYRAITKKEFLPGPNGRGRCYGTFDTRLDSVDFALGMDIEGH
ncbi:hypothetical protein PG994_001790 [Apiospora phragmitis]|uniref:Uncharacterized protein n=1 Tax=Apiospora phragmitis TaxID=2905665 RepID=A0ABR1WUJ8_9PEZI